MPVRLPDTDRLPPVLAGAIASAVYLFGTMAPGLTFIDAGELATVACTLGIAHPTGYPLFTLLGWAAAHLPAVMEPIGWLNAMAALLCGAGIMVFTRLLSFLLGRVSGEKGWRVQTAALGGGLLLAFSETYWLQATAIEVYSLHCLLLALLLYVFLKANERQAGGGHDRLWWLFAYLLGVSFTNHMTTILLAPGFLYYYFARQGAGSGAWKRMGLMGIPFLLGLSLYLYLPLRALHRPVLNWGNPATLERLLWHISGKQYRVWIFSSTESASRQLGYFLQSFPAEFAFIGVILALPGLIGLWKRERKLLVFTLLLFTGCIAYSVNYDIHDIDSYFLLAYVATAIWAAFGLFQAGSWIEKGAARVFRANAAVWARGLLAGAALVPLAVNWGGVSERDNYAVEDYTRNMFASLAPGALVLSYQWDYWVSASYYNQVVRGVRGDLTVVDKELLRRSWYLAQLERSYPWLIGGSRGEVDAFLREVYRFEHDLPYNAPVIEGRFAGMIRSFLAGSIAARPVYVTEEVEEAYTGGFQRVPEGLAFRLYADTLFHPTAMPEFLIRPIRKQGRLEEQTRRLYASAYIARGDYYYLKRSDRSEAGLWYRKALELFPGEAAILARLARTGNQGGS